MHYKILAYYCFTPIADPYGEVAAHFAFFEGRDVTCRIYISEEGINGQMCAACQDAEAYMDWIHQREPFSAIQFKVTPHYEHVFPRVTVKYRKQLVAIDAEIDLSKKGQHLSPKQWRSKLEEPGDRVLLDVRNDYEWKVGRFAGADLPPCDTFRDFDAYADQLKEKVDPVNTPVMMYCTGGIRCELYSALLKQRGFEKVYQLQGGVIGYGLEEGSNHWLGKLFVFDDRLAVPVCDGAETPTIGSCHHCGSPNDTYYNCANMDCNYLFLCCPDCLKKFAGCCQSSCMAAPRTRPYHQQSAHKPFRRAHFYEQMK